MSGSSHRSRRADTIPLYSPRLAAVFGRYNRWYLRRSFSAVRLARSRAAVELGRPTIFYCNHPSWWDPLIMFAVITRQFPGCRLFGPMAAGALLDRYWILRRVGAFAVAAGGVAGARFFLVQAERVLREPGNALCIAAQGAFVDARARPARLATGVARLLMADRERQAVPVSIEYTFWNERKPEALVSFGPPVHVANGTSRRAVLETTHAALARRLEATQDALALDAMQRRPHRFEMLLEGDRGGVGFVYDACERARSWIRGKRFDPSHGSIGSS